MAKTLEREAFRFFEEHAGYSTPPGRAVCAAQLARVESWARFEQERGSLVVEWVEDDDCDTSWADEQTLDELRSGLLVALGCVVTYSRPLAWSGATTEEHASLWGVVVRGINDPYCRVVAAELCSELEQLAPRRA